MTASANTETITVECDGQTITVALDQATDLVMKVIEARKLGYAARRAVKTEKNAAHKAELAAKKVAREAKAAARKNEQSRKLLEKTIALLDPKDPVRKTLETRLAAIAA